MRVLNDRDWLRLLRDERAVLSLPLHGHHTVPEGWRVRYTLDEHLLYFVTDGEAEGTIGGQSVTLSAGTAIWVLPDTPFDLGLSRRRKPITLYRFRLRVARSRQAVAPGRKAMVLRSAWPARLWFEHIIGELEAGRRYRDERLRALLVALFVDLFRLERAGRDGGVLTPGQCDRLRQCVDADPAGRCTPADLATELGLTPDYFTRLFRRTFGVPPRRWLVQERIRRAAYCLTDTDASVGEVAEALGYPDLFLFSRQFKSVMGVSPRRYRSRVPTSHE